jgi:RNA-directed DNA polymerase
MKIQLTHKFENIISLENLLAAWREFLAGKRQRNDVQVFESALMDNIFSLHHDLLYHRYQPGGYKAFKGSDPKPRNIHKASIRDRLLHHAIYRLLYPFFDKIFISDSYSCRLGKGTHKAINQFNNYFLKVSRNNKRNGWVLKCDIKKFFASIDHKILLTILEKHIPDKNIMRLLEKVINSFHLKTVGKGLPLGNLTSQLFCNIYMNQFDQFVKHRLKIQNYIRYADDFVFLAEDKNQLLSIMPKILEFLEKRLCLSLHPDKVSIKTFSSGIDFLGWVNFPEYRVLRLSTKKRMFRRIKEHPTNETLQSYLGLLSHGNTYKAQEELLNLFGLFRESKII